VWDVDGTREHGTWTAITIVVAAAACAPSAAGDEQVAPTLGTLEVQGVMRVMAVDGAGSFGDGVRDGIMAWTFSACDPLEVLCQPLGTVYSTWHAFESAMWSRPCPPACTGVDGTKDIVRYRDAWVDRAECVSDANTGAASGHIVWASGLTMPINRCDVYYRSKSGGVLVPSGGDAVVDCWAMPSFSLRIVDVPIHGPGLPFQESPAAAGVIAIEGVPAHLETEATCYVGSYKL
jgi:hypothetical protein